MGGDEPDADAMSKLCEALGLELFLRPTRRSRGFDAPAAKTLKQELGLPDSDAVGLLIGELGTGTDDSRVVAPANLVDNERRAELIGWIDSFWENNGPDRRVWLFEDLRQRYESFESWLRGPSRKSAKGALKSEGEGVASLKIRGVKT